MCYSTAHVNIPAERRMKAQKMRPGAWIGYLVDYQGKNGHQYRVCDPKKRKVWVVRDITFHGSEAPGTYNVFSMTKPEGISDDELP